LLFAIGEDLKGDKEGLFVEGIVKKREEGS
jgi:hypothetical protein